MDFVFRNDASDFMINMDTTVEKLGHAFHMQEIWTKAQPFYLELKKNPQPNMRQVRQKLIDIISYTYTFKCLEVYCYRPVIKLDWRLPFVIE